MRDWFLEGLKIALVALCAIALVGALVTNDYSAATLALLALAIIYMLGDDNDERRTRT